MPPPVITTLVTGQRAVDRETAIAARLPARARADLLPLSKSGDPVVDLARAIQGKEESDAAQVSEDDSGAVGVPDGGLRQDAGDRQGHG